MTRKPLKQCTSDRFKTKPTTVFGVQFRSKLEACWAMFFQRLGIPWSYEPHRFCYRDYSYTPDFLLGFKDFCLWVEIKPSTANQSYLPSYEAFAAGLSNINRPIHKYAIFYGTPYEHQMRTFDDYPYDSYFQSTKCSTLAIQCCSRDVEIYRSVVARANRLLTSHKPNLVSLAKTTYELATYTVDMPGCWEAINLYERCSKLYNRNVTLKLFDRIPSANHDWSSTVTVP